jgi:hypothetical protein
MDADPDPRLKLLETARQRSEENAADLAAFNAGCLHVAQQCVDLWHRRWFGRLAVDSAQEVKFRICFPLAAHALNHVETALSLYEQRPWVAASSTRVAFEHALAAQWVLLTDGGERELVNWMEGQRHLRVKEFADALSRLASEPDASVATLSEFEHQALVGDPPDASSWSVFNACSRFSDTKLFYDIYRNLSQAEHPSLGLIATHLVVTPAGVQNDLSAAGALKPSDEVPRALGLSALWSLYVLEQLRDGQPHAAAVARIGDEASLPTDLRASDRYPERQPGAEHPTGV